MASLELRGAELPASSTRTRIAGGESQPRQVRQDANPPLAVTFRRSRAIEFRDGALPDGFVEGGFLGGQLDVQGDLGTLGQVLDDLALQAPQDEGRDHPPQPGARVFVAVPFDGQAEALPKPLVGAEQPGVREGEQGIQVHQVVLDGRAGGDEAEVGAQPPCGPGALGARVLDRLGFVEHGAVPGSFRQRVDVVLQHAVSGQIQVERRRLRQQPRPGAGRADQRPDPERRCEAPRLLGPVGDHGRGRHHQGGSAGSPFHEQCEGLHRLAEAHVVRQACAGAPAAQARQPAKAVRLVGTQFGLQGARQLGFEGLRGRATRAPLAPLPVRRDLRFLQQIVERQGAERMQGRRAVARGRRQTREVVQLTAERGRQRKEISGREFQEAGARAGVQQGEQALQIEHALVVELEFAGGLQPLGRRLDGERQRAGGCVRHDAQGFAARPLAARAGVLQPIEELQAVARIREEQRLALGRPRRQPGAAFEQAGEGAALGLQVAPGADILAVPDGEDGDAAGAGFEAEAGVGHGLHRQRGLQAGIVGFEPHPWLRVGLDQGGVRRVVVDAAVHAHFGCEGGDRFEQPRAGRQREPDALGRYDLEQPPARGREVGHFATPTADLVRVVRVVVEVGLVRRHRRGHPLGVLFETQLRLPPHDVQRRALGIEDVGVPRERVQTCGAEGVVFVPVPFPCHRDRRRRGAIFGAQERQVGPLLGETLQRHLPALAPTAALVAALLPGVEFDAPVVLADFPDESAFGCRGSLPRRLAGGVVGVLLQRPQGALPRGGRDGEARQRHGPQARVKVVRGPVPGSPGRARAAQEHIAFRRYPVQPAGVGLLAIHGQRFAPRRLLDHVAAAPDQGQSVEQQAETGERLARVVDEFFPLRGPGVADDAQLLVAADPPPLGGIQQPFEQVGGFRSGGPYEREQRQGEGTGVREHDASARAALLRREGRLEVRPGVGVRAAQQRQQGPGGGQSGGGGPRLPFGGGQGGEDPGGGVEFSLQDAQERDVRGVAGQLARQIQAGIDDGIRRDRGIDDVGKAIPQGVLPVYGRQALQEIDGDRVRQEPPATLRRGLAPGQFVEGREVAEDDVRAQQHGLVGAVPARRRASLEERLHDLRQGVRLVRRPREEQFPARHRADAIVVAHHDGGGFELVDRRANLLVLQAIARDGDVGRREHFAQARHAHRQREQGPDDRGDRAGGRGDGGVGGGHGSLHAGSMPRCRPSGQTLRRALAVGARVDRDRGLA